jgi:hypothetical protein
MSEPAQICLLPGGPGVLRDALVAAPEYEGWVVHVLLSAPAVLPFIFHNFIAKAASGHVADYSAFVAFSP